MLNSCVLRDIVIFVILFLSSCLAIIFSPMCASFIFKLGSTEGQHGQPRQITVPWVPESNFILDNVFWGAQRRTMKIYSGSSWTSTGGLDKRIWEESCNCLPHPLSPGYFSRVSRKYSLQVACCNWLLQRRTSFIFINKTAWRDDWEGHDPKRWGAVLVY